MNSHGAGATARLMFRSEVAWSVARLGTTTLVRMVSGIASAFLVAGCASTPNISLDKSKVGPITTASLLLIPESRQVMVRNLSGLSGLGGALGGVIAGSAEVSRNEAFLKEYNQGTTRLSTALADDLQRELSASGIQVSYTPSEFAKLKDGVDDYSHVNTDKDAILSVWFGPVGFIADGVIDAPYEPWVVVHVRLLHSTTKQILSQKTYTSGYKAKTDGAVFVPCATDYRFATFEKLMSEFAQSVEALAECNSAVARQAAQDLN